MADQAFIWVLRAAGVFILGAGAMHIGLGLNADLLLGAGVSAQPRYVAEPPYRYLNDQGLRSKRYRAPTPADVPGAGTVSTAQLVAMLTTRQAKIHDMRLAVAVDHDVFRLDIPMDNPSVVGVMERGSHFGPVSCFHE